MSHNGTNVLTWMIIALVDPAYLFPLALFGACQVRGPIKINKQFELLNF